MRDFFLYKIIHLRERSVLPPLYLEKRYRCREIIPYFSPGTWALTLKALQVLFGLGICFPGFGLLQTPRPSPAPPLYVLLQVFPET